MEGKRGAVKTQDQEALHDPSQLHSDSIGKLSRLRSLVLRDLNELGVGTYGEG